MKQLLPICLAVTLLTASACDKNDDPQPTPEPTTTVSMTRTMTYPMAPSRNNGLTYTQKSMTSTGKLTSDELNLSFGVQEGSDEFSLTVPQAALTSGLKGTYQLRSQTAQSAVALARYSYYRVNMPGSLSATIYSSQSITRGQFIITEYDAQRQVLSGSFEVELNDIADPTDGNAPLGDLPRCDLKVTGTFAQLKLQP